MGVLRDDVLEGGWAEVGVQGGGGRGGGNVLKAGWVRL